MYNDTYLVGNIVMIECQHFFVNIVAMMRILTIFFIKIRYLDFEKETFISTPLFSHRIECRENSAIN